MAEVRAALGRQEELVERLTIRHRYADGRWRTPLTAPLESLQTVMDTANRHFSENPERVLGGPTLPKART